MISSASKLCVSIQQLTSPRDLPHRWLIQRNGRNHHTHSRQLHFELSVTTSLLVACAFAIALINSTFAAACNKQSPEDFRVTDIVAYFSAAVVLSVIATLYFYLGLSLCLAVLASFLGVLSMELAVITGIVACIPLALFINGITPQVPPAPPAPRQNRARRNVPARVNIDAPPLYATH